MFRLHYCWLTYCIKMCDELWFLSLAFGSDVRLVFDQMTQRRETKQKRLSEPQQTCGCAVDAFITADLQRKQSLADMDGQHQKPSVIQRRIKIVHETLGQSAQRTQNAIRDVLRPERRPRVKTHINCHESFIALLGNWAPSLMSWMGCCPHSPRMTVHLCCNYFTYVNLCCRQYFDKTPTHL